MAFCKKNMFEKNLVYELWSKNLNAEFFKLQYLTNNLRYEVQFLDITKGLWKQQMLVGCFKWVLLDMPKHVQSDSK